MCLHIFADCTLLDCVFDETAKTFYILDVMGWVNQVFYDSEVSRTAGNLVGDEVIIYYIQYSSHCFMLLDRVQVLLATD